MRKKTIGMLYSIGLLLLTISVVLFIQLLVSLRGNTQPNVELVVIEIVVSFTGGILMLLCWIETKINLGKAGQWKWFLFLLLLSVFAIPVYLCTGPVPELHADRKHGPLVKL
jgi:hypothetical protein